VSPSLSSAIFIHVHDKNNIASQRTAQRISSHPSAACVWMPLNRSMYLVSYRIVAGCFRSAEDEIVVFLSDRFDSSYCCSDTKRGGGGTFTNVRVFVKCNIWREQFQRYRQFTLSATYTETCDVHCLSWHRKTILCASVVFDKSGEMHKIICIFIEVTDSFTACRRNVIRDILTNCT